jgi:hypothetical protein
MTEMIAGLFDQLHGETSIQQRFEQFHQAHPSVFELFTAFATQKLLEGHTRYSADAILHRVRWEMEGQWQESGFKINNDFSSRYARLLSRTDERFADFFEFRRLLRH